MNPKTVIKGKIHYVGVNDRNKHLFEGMWPLPYGVSYNSYLIDDETVALIDTVDICYFEVYLRKIKSIIGERPIQYLIINHMEHFRYIRKQCSLQKNGKKHDEKYHVKNVVFKHRAAAPCHYRKHNGRRSAKSRPRN